MFVGFLGGYSHNSSPLLYQRLNQMSTETGLPEEEIGDPRSSLEEEIDEGADNRTDEEESELENHHEEGDDEDRHQDEEYPEIQEHREATRGGHDGLLSDLAAAQIFSKEGSMRVGGRSRRDFASKMPNFAVCIS